MNLKKLNLREVNIDDQKLIFKEKFHSKNKAISREYYIKKNRTFRNKIKDLYQ